MLNKLLRLLQSREDNAISDIYNDIYYYWKAINDFTIAHQRYLQDLNYRFKLDFDENQISMIPSTILIQLIGMGLSQPNAIFIFSQFVFYHIFGGQKPNRLRNPDNYIERTIEKIEELLVPPETTWGGFQLVLSKKNFKSLT